MKKNNFWLIKSNIQHFNKNNKFGDHRKEIRVLTLNEEETECSHVPTLH